MANTEIYVDFDGEYCDNCSSNGGPIVDKDCPVKKYLQQKSDKGDINIEVAQAQRLGLELAEPVRKINEYEGTGYEADMYCVHKDDDELEGYLTIYQSPA